MIHARAFEHCVHLAEGLLGPVLLQPLQQLHDARARIGNDLGALALAQEHADIELGLGYINADDEHG